MPEVSEINVICHYISDKIKNYRLTEIEILHGKYKKKRFSGFELFKNKKFIIKEINSKGKQLYFVLESVDDEKYKIYFMTHLGLSGNYTFEQNEKDNIRLHFYNKITDTKHILCLYDPRGIGTVEILEEPAFNKKINSLAFDALKTEFTDDEFIQIIKKYFFIGKSQRISQPKLKNTIIKVLFEQQTTRGILSGLGNYLIAEILYNAKISPYRTMGSLKNNELISLSHAIKYITKLSYYNNTHGYLKHIKDFIVKHKKKIDKKKLPEYHEDIKLKKNAEFTFKVYQQKIDPKGNEVIPDKTIHVGRTTYWCPTIQM